MEIELTEAAIVRVEPGDVIVARYPMRVSAAQAAGVLEALERWFPGHQVGLMDSGGEVTVVRP